jgi:5-methylthioadenosine/S-adenosylhomocysteine deaminase
VTHPALPGSYIEIKSRTWSRRDAEEKAGLISELLATLGIQDAASVSQEYAELAASGSS